MNREPGGLPLSMAGEGKSCRLAVLVWRWTAIRGELAPESLAMVSDGKTEILIWPCTSCVTSGKLLDY